MPEDLVAQLPYIKEVVEGFNMPVIELQGYEADDLIGTLSRRAQQEGFSVVMVTGDKDFLQLVTEKALIWDPMKDKITEERTIRESMEIEPRQIVEVMGLSGDTADNIPGVTGIGPKTALSLIQTFGTIDKLYEQVQTITKAKQRENLTRCKEQAFLSRKLVAINTETPISYDIEEFHLKEPDETKLFELFKMLEFKQLQQA